MPLAGFPRLLVQTPDLLQMPHFQVKYHDINGIHLVTWQLFSDVFCEASFSAKLVVFRHTMSLRIDTQKYSLRIFGHLFDSAEAEMLVQLTYL